MVSYWWCVATAALGQTDRDVAGNLHQIELIVSSSYIMVMGKLILFSETVSLGLIWDSICFGPWKKWQCIVCWLFQFLDIVTWHCVFTPNYHGTVVPVSFGLIWDTVFPNEKKNNSSKRKERLGWDRIGSLTIKLTVVMLLWQSSKLLPCCCGSASLSSMEQHPQNLVFLFVCHLNDHCSLLVCRTCSTDHHASCSYLVTKRNNLLLDVF